jgi:hypothetical protein
MNPMNSKRPSLGNLVPTRAVGQKFHEDGSVRHFPGNTIICTIDEDNPAYARLIEVSESVKALSCSGKFTLLPPSSYHMTVIQGVCEEERKPELWSRYLSLDTPLEETDRFFMEKWQDIGIPEGFEMKFNYFHTDGTALTINLIPQTQKTANELKTFRDEVAEKLGLRFPNHDDYKFHISIGYKLYELTEEEEHELQSCKRQVEREMQLVLFKDMFAFGESR